MAATVQERSMPNVPARPDYRKPEVRTVEARILLAALGPVSAGSSTTSGVCGPMLANYCP
jgi:hypothetical protein